jgi:hypothetical protein
MISLVLVSAIALFRATLSSQDPLLPQALPVSGPHPVDGLWAALPAACETPTSLNLALWPACAVPIGFLGGELAPLQKPEPGSAAERSYVALARTHYQVEAGSPDIVEVDVPIMFSRSTIYIALQPDAMDPAQGFTAATGWPVGCPASPMEGVIHRGARCVATTAAGGRAAAALSVDPAATYRLVRVAGGADQPLGVLPAPAASAPDAGAGQGGAPSAPASQFASPSTSPQGPPPTPLPSAPIAAPASDGAAPSEMGPPAADPASPPATPPTAPPSPVEEAPLAAPGDPPPPGHSGQ